ncbi:conserved hypothetical protein [Vibrio phage 191E37-1]|nr:conserved hypothetical protein [Vibrio phage 191E37-1]
MENMTKESKLSFTSNPVNSDSPKGFYSRCVAVNENQGMTTTENKLAMLSRIALLLARKGLYATIDFNGEYPEHSNFFAHGMRGNGCGIVEHFQVKDVTEQELLDWWSAIEG